MNQFVDQNVRSYQVQQYQKEMLKKNETVENNKNNRYIIQSQIGYKENVKEVDKMHKKM